MIGLTLFRLAGNVIQRNEKMIPCIGFSQLLGMMFGITFSLLNWYEAQEFMRGVLNPSKREVQ